MIGVGGILGVLIVGLVLSLISVFDDAGMGAREHGMPISESGQTSDAEVGSPEISIGAGDGEFPSKAPIVLPASTAMGPHDVATGYPQSPEGAVAQLTAVVVAIHQGEHRQAEVVHRTWSVPGLVKGDRNAHGQSLGSVRDLLARASTGRPDTLMAAFARSRPPFEHDVCVLAAMGRDRFEAAVLHCRTMVWTDGHWVMGRVIGAESVYGVPRSLAQAERAGFRLIQGAAAPDSR
ncbi:hypothetical protein [Kineosporia babensis]|uniref:Uncharacterized protein n=1 Tax=Kineosporia babensis TaxID=499548 RepID=A0A9X1NL58_9ACTN|nr:hypothetical protein [Kineosporia babensis]MCD5316115.1 hypothetical protein [Kineosporia babensis]